MFDYLKSKVSSAVNDLGQAISGGQEAQAERLRARIRDLDMQLERKQAILDNKLQQRFEALYPKEPVAGFAEDRYGDLDPINFASRGEESWLATLAHQIIERFPGAQTLLSKLDVSLLAFSETNDLRVRPNGPYSELLEARDKILRLYDIDQEIPLFISNGRRSEVVGCSEPFVILDRLDIDGLTQHQREVFLATLLGHVFFGNLKIFAFHRLMGLLDKMPSVAGLVQKGLGMIPGVGNTISRGFELARSVNENLIRKTNLIIGLQNHLRCDRLAMLYARDPEVILGLHARSCFGGGVEEHKDLIPRLIEQGASVDDKFQKGIIDLHMLAVIGPSSSFGAYRAYKFDTWSRQDRSQKILDGYYVTRERVRGFVKKHGQLERDIEVEQSRIFELEQELQQLRSQLDRLVMAGEDAEEEVDGPEPPPAGPR